jgi:DHA3 family macrolide efflux protein-like MFS transporter
MLSIPLYFARNNNSGTFNFAYGLITLSTLVWGMFAGTLVDQYSRKNVFICTSLIQALMLLGVSSIGFASGSIPDLLILAVFSTTLLGYQIHYPNLYAFAQEITPSQQYARITSQLEISGQCTSVLSGALAALLLAGCQQGINPGLWHQLTVFLPAIEPWSLGEIFAFDGITYLVAALLISRIRYEALSSSRADDSSVFNRIGACLAFIREKPLLIVFGSFSNVVFVAVSVQLHTLMPSYLLNQLRTGAFMTGAAQAVFAGGALLAGLTARRIFAGFSTPQTIILLMALAGCGFATLAISSSTFLFCIFCLLAGFANTGIRIFRLTWLLKKVPNYLIGRINSVFTISNTAMRASFSLLFSQAYFTSGSRITVPFLIIGLYVVASAMIIMLVSRQKVYTRTSVSNQMLVAAEQ